MRLFRHVLAAAFAGALAAGCAGPGAGPAGASGSRMEQEQSRQVLAELRQKDMLWEGERLNGYVDRIADRVDRGRPRDSQPLKVFVIKDPEANAFTTGAGYIFVHAGLLALMENEAQFAMVMAHEAAHVDRGHVTAGMQQRQQVGLLGTLAGLAGMAAGVPNELMRLGVGLGQQYVVSDFSREQEREADSVGLRYMADAGYNAAAGARSFEVMGRLYQEQGGLSQFFASHPSSSDRLAELRRQAERLDAGSGRVATEEYLSTTRHVREQALEWYERNDRDTLAAQARRNLRRGG